MMYMFTRETIITDLAKGIQNCKVKIKVNVPDVTIDTIKTNRATCKKNLCGHYNTSWTCPPNSGSEEDWVQKFKERTDADVIIMTFDNVDLNDKESMEKTISDFQKECRRIMIECRKNGFDVIALSGGPCNNCKRCAFLDGKPCRQPDMQIPSVSGCGVDMGAFLSSIGESFNFEKNKITYYGLFLFRTPSS